METLVDEIADGIFRFSTLNEWLAAAPNATVAHGGLGCAVSIDDLADRPPRRLEDNEVIDLGGKRVRHLDTPHVPHAWEARLLYEETTSTLLCGDLFTQAGNGVAVTEGDIIGPSVELEQMMRYTSNVPALVATVRGLAELAPATLACMHGSSYRGDGSKALIQLADAYEEAFVTA